MRAKISSNSVARFVRSKTIFPIKFALTLGKAMVRSVLGYGVELTAWERHEEDDKVMRGFVKKMLGTSF